MKILVCIKQVPDLDAAVVIDDSSGWVKQDRSIPPRMNRFDECALEEALLMAETLPGTSIDAVSVGPDRCVSVIRRAMGMGADHGVHILTQEEGYESALVTASLIASFARGRGYDLILTGVMSEDLMQGQVGPMIAALSEMPCATSVVFQRISERLDTVYAEREIEGGLRDALELRLPAVLTIQSGINKPRYPSLSKMLRANKVKPETVEAGSLNPLPAGDRITGISYPRKSRAAKILEGTPGEKASELVRILRQRSIVR